MKPLDVRIERLEPTRVASVRVVGEHPEQEAWEKLRAWAEPAGLFDDKDKYPIFGFNNPPLSISSDKYGYEFWLCIGDEPVPEGPVKVKVFDGGLYAVTTYEGFPNPDAWMRLWMWVMESTHKWRRTQELERALELRMEEGIAKFDLYLPIEG